MLEKVKKISIRAFAALLSPFTFLLFCFLPIAVQAQTVPDEIFGEYEGEGQVTNSTFGIDETMDLSVFFENAGAGNYVLKIDDLELIDDLEIPLEMDNIIVTPITGGGYRLSRSGPVNFVIPEITIPPTPPLFPDGGTFTNVPVRVTLGNSQIVNYVLQLNVEVRATLMVIIPVTFNITFEGVISPPPTITTTHLPSGTVDEEYHATLEATGPTPITWSITEGALPAGLTLNELTGVISGTPTEPDTLQFTVMATNEFGNDTKLLTIEIEDIDDIDTVGIGTMNIAPLKVYPNPTTGELRIESEEWRIENVEVYDINGRTVGAYPCGRPETTINVSHLPEGTYLLKIQTEQGTQTRKIIKR